ncbi:hypothetical protein Tco_0739839 [Tanacetum coccineum]
MASCKPGKTPAKDTVSRGYCTTTSGSLDKNPKPATGLQSALALITPGWAAAFASPPAAMSFAMIAAGAAEKSLHASKKSSAANLKDKAAARATTLAVACDLKRNNKISSQRGLSVVAITSSQRRIYGKYFNALSYKFVALLVGSLAFARNMQLSEVDRRARFDLLLSTVDALVYMPGASLSITKLRLVLNCVFNYMETFTRMHRCLRRDFKGSNHSGIFAISEDPLKLERDKQNSVLALEALSSSLVNEDDDQDAFVNVDFNIDEMWLHEDIQTRPSAITEQQWTFHITKFKISLLINTDGMVR